MEEKELKPDEKKRIERKLTALMSLMVVISIASFALIYNHSGQAEIALIGGGVTAFFLTLLGCYDVLFRSSRHEVRPLLSEPEVKKESLVSSKEIPVPKIPRPLRPPRRQPEIPSGRKVFRGQGAVRTAQERKLWHNKDPIEPNEED